jgi:hypothetical protein
MAELMGRNEYARHRGCAPNAVSKAIDSGRIKAAVVYDAAGKFEGINWEAADALWAMNTDPGEAAKNGKFYVVPPAAQAPADPAAPLAVVAAAPSPEAAVPAVAAAPGAAGMEGEPDLLSASRESQDDNNATYLAARARKEQFAAKSAELAYLQTIGKLVDVAAVRSQLMEALGQLKTSAMRIPDRKAQMLAAETDPARVNRILSEELRSVFDECSRQFADDAAGGIEEPASACS